MQKLNFPTYQFKVKKNPSNELYIYDVVRKKYVKLTPEEWVRQHAVNYLLHSKKIRKSLIKVETSLHVNDTLYRVDVLCVSSLGENLLLLECKEPREKISQATFDQLMRYNNVLLSKYVWITNGLEHFIYELNKNKGEYEKISIQSLFDNSFSS